MSTKFQIENWREHYHAKLDGEELLDQIESLGEGESASIDLSGDKLTTKVTNELDCYIEVVEYVDDETGDEDEIELEISGDLKYTVEYRISDELIHDEIDDIEAALAESVESGQSTFEVRVFAVPVSVSDVSIDQVDCYDLDEYDERKIYDMALRQVTNRLEHASGQAHSGDLLRPPTEKELTFICTIPAE